MRVHSWRSATSPEAAWILAFGPIVECDESVCARRNFRDMSQWIDRLKTAAGLSAVPPAFTARVTVWRALQPSPLTQSPHAASWVVVDVESSGLDAARDALIAIGAVGIEAGAVCLGRSFECVLQQSQASTHDNILVHRIGQHEQRQGVPAAEALMAFLEFCGRAPLVAYHAPFDALMLSRAFRAHLGFSPSIEWLDLAALAPMIDHASAARTGTQTRSLDDWLDQWNIAVHQRHRAVSDALAEAVLFQRLLARLDKCKQDVSTVGRLLAAAHAMAHP